MARPSTREEFKNYCLRKLGAPVINIELSDDQIEDRIDEALQFWKDYHHDGSELIYFKYQLTQEDVTNGFITTPSTFIGVVRIFSLPSTTSGSGMFSIQYQYMLNNMRDISSGMLPNYVATRQNMELINEIINGLPMIRFNRLSNKLSLDISASKLIPGNWIIIEAYDGQDENNSEIWRDHWLMSYATALIKENWGSVLTKFQSAQLVGGMTFSGDQILNDAREERRKLEEEVTRSFGPGLNYFLG